MPGTAMSAYAAVPAPSRAYWYCQAIGWALYAAFSVVVFASLTHFSSNLSLIVLVLSLTLLGLTHALRYHIWAWSWPRLPPLSLLGRLLVANLVLSVLSQVIVWLLIRWTLHPAPGEQPTEWEQFARFTVNINLLLWLWEGFYFGWHYLSSSRQAEVDKWKLAAAVREAEMRTLKAQINPHFMFNGLNNIRALVMEDPARARAMITHLSDLLRYSIQLNSTEQVPLARELEIVEHYLQLEAIQLEERLSYSIDVDPAALPVLIPPMTVQLLVENAIKHGLAPRPNGGTIQLTAQLNDSNTLHLRVRNTGHYAPDPSQPQGVGLRNARERLALLFGPAAHLHLANDPHCPNTVVAHLQLPIRPAMEPSVIPSGTVGPSIQIPSPVTQISANS